MMKLSFAWRAFLGVSLLVAGAASAQETTLRRITPADGSEPNGIAGSPSISANGDVVVFESTATNLVANDSNNISDIFAWYRRTGEIQRVSVASDGTQSNGSYNRKPKVSANGRFVVFESSATNLDPAATIGAQRIYLRDLQAGATEVVSISSTGTISTGSNPVVSSDGRYVAFHSSNALVPNDSNGTEDVYIRDRESETTECASVHTDGIIGNSHSVSADISRDGRYVAFASYATNLVAGDSGIGVDIFERDRQLGTTTRVTFGADGFEANSHSEAPKYSGDGNVLAFNSFATNLLSGVTTTQQEVFLWTRATGNVINPIRELGLDPSQDMYFQSLSYTGRWVLCFSRASNVVSPDANASHDVYLIDRGTATVTRISNSTDGVIGDGDSLSAAISDYALDVVFMTEATNLVAGDSNGMEDILIRSMASLDVETLKGRIKDASKPGADFVQINGTFVFGDPAQNESFDPFTEDLSFTMAGPEGAIAEFTVEAGHSRWRTTPGGGFRWTSAPGSSPAAIVVLKPTKRIFSIQIRKLSFDTAPTNPISIELSIGADRLMDSRSWTPHPKIAGLFKLE